MNPVAIFLNESPLGWLGNRTRVEDIKRSRVLLEFVILCLRARASRVSVHMHECKWQELPPCAKFPPVRDQGSLRCGVERVPGTPPNSTTHTTASCTDGNCLRSRACRKGVRSPLM